MCWSKIKYLFRKVFNKTSSKTQTPEDNYKWDSFSDRICDDLSEFILNFLPIKERFRLECVSKQFQRTILEKHHQLIVNEDMGLKDFRNIIKKLPNIRSLKIRSVLKDSDIELIIKCCNKLTEFSGHFMSENMFQYRKISEECKQLFAKKFGPQLTSLAFNDLCFESTVESFINIQEIELKDWFNEYDIYQKHNKYGLNFVFKIKPKNLKKVSIYISTYVYDITFQTFICNNKSITHLSIHDFFGHTFDVKLEVISQLKQLISLELVLHYIELNSLTNCLKYLPHNCYKLKSLTLEFDEITGDLKTNDFMSQIKRFIQLKRFKFVFSTNSFPDFPQFNNYLQNSLKTGFEFLTHLTIGFSGHPLTALNEKFIEYIVRFRLPYLQNLIITYPVTVTKQTPHILSGHSKLKVLELIIRGKLSICGSFKKKVIKKCKNLKSIRISSEL